MWDEVTYPFPNFNGAAVEIWEWISNITPHCIGHVITYTCCRVWKNDRYQTTTKHDTAGTACIVLARYSMTIFMAHQTSFCSRIFFHFDSLRYSFFGPHSNPSNATPIVSKSKSHAIFTKIVMVYGFIDISWLNHIIFIPISNRVAFLVPWHIGNHKTTSVRVR